MRHRFLGPVDEFLLHPLPTGDELALLFRRQSTDMELCDALLAILKFPFGGRRTFFIRQARIFRSEMASQMAGTAVAIEFESKEADSDPNYKRHQNETQCRIVHESTPIRRRGL